MKHFKSRKRSARDRRKAAAKERRRLEAKAGAVEKALTPGIRTFDDGDWRTMTGRTRMMAKSQNFARRYAHDPHHTPIQGLGAGPVVSVDFAQLETRVRALETERALTPNPLLEGFDPSRIADAFAADLAALGKKKP